MNRWTLQHPASDYVAALPEPQQAVFDRLYKFESGVVQLQFPDGRRIDMQRNWVYIDVRVPGGEWEGTLLRSVYQLIDWLEETKVTLAE